MLNSKPIGGYFELELNGSNELYKDFYRFNLARNAIAYFFESRGVSTVHVPTYTCNSVTDVLLRNGFQLKYYNIVDLLDIRFPLVDSGEGLLIINYFGLFNEFPTQRYNEGVALLVDNSQAFFNNSFEEAVYSPRKFFGITDGAYLKVKTSLPKYHLLPDYKALNLMEPLVRRIDDGAEEAFSSYSQIHTIYSSAPIAKMSNFSARMLRSIDYERVRKTRLENFQFLHERLANVNALRIGDRSSYFCYPLYVANGPVVHGIIW